MAAITYDAVAASSIQSSGQVQMRRLIGINFANFDAARSADWIAAQPAAMPFSYVVTPNADHLVRLSRDPSLMPLYQNASLCLMDSRVVARTANLLGLNPSMVSTGSDVTARLLAEHLRPGERITIIGVADEYIGDLVRNTGIAQPAHYNPPMGFDRIPGEMDRAVQFVVDHPARFVFLAVGSPKQEKLAAAISATGLATGTGLCIGASLEFLAGATVRAPHVMRKAGLEWFHRLLSNPRRHARRYLVDNPRIFQLLWKESRKAGPNATPPVTRHQLNSGTLR